MTTRDRATDQLAHLSQTCLPVAGMRRDTRDVRQA